MIVHDCRPSVTVEALPIIGEVSKITFADDWIFFNIGALKIQVSGVAKPDWFVEGVIVRVDFQENTVQTLTDSELNPI